MTTALFTLTDDQQNALDAFGSFMLDPIETVFLLSGYSGTGKEQPVSTTVQTPQGPRRFGDLIVGDFVFGVDGKPTKVTGIFPQGVKPVFHVTFRDHTTARCGIDHLWQVHTKKASGSWKVKTTRELINGGLTNSAGPKYRVPLCAPVEYAKQNLPFDPYFIGALIGDGYLGGGGTPALSNAEVDVDIIVRIRASLPEHFELNYRNTDSCPQYNIVDKLKHNGNRLKDHLKEIGLDVGSHGKHIPAQYLRSSVEDRIALLQGLMDTDGCSQNNRITFSTMSFDLAKDVQTLVRSLGGVAILNTFDRTHHDKGVEYSVNVRSTINPFHCARKAVNWKSSTKNPPSKYIRSIEQDGQEKQMCIMVDSPDHLYLTDDFIVTHNTTLVKTLIERMPKFLKAAALIDPDMPAYTTELTATTNKAAENFGQLTGLPVATIHSFLGLRVQTDYRTNTTTLMPSSTVPKEGVLLFVDEASYVDKQLLGLIFKLTKRCKIVFIGDPAQLTPVKSASTPVFDAHFTGAHLSQVVRQAEGNPIVALSTKFRNTVKSGEFFSFTPDGHAVQYLDRPVFNQAIEAEFMRPDWKYADSKVLGWTNKCVIGYNHAIRDHVKGDANFQEGDYAVCNSFVSAGRQSLKTDQMVRITEIGPDTEEYGVPGNVFTLNGSLCAFAPKSLADKNARIKQARIEENFTAIEQMESRWIDLRAAYSCTINKSQGSTFDRVFIDLDDIRRCNSGDQIARMLYVGVSRAKSQVFLTGDIA